MGRTFYLNSIIECIDSDKPIELNSIVLYQNVKIRRITNIDDNIILTNKMELIDFNSIKPIDIFISTKDLMYYKDDKVYLEKYNPKTRLIIDKRVCTIISIEGSEFQCIDKENNILSNKDYIYNKLIGEPSDRFISKVLELDIRNKSRVKVICDILPRLEPETHKLKIVPC